MYKVSFSFHGKICKIHGLFLLGRPCKMPPSEHVVQWLVPAMMYSSIAGL